MGAGTADREWPTALPVIGFVAYSGTGKTTLLEQVVAQLSARGIRLAVIKHAHHDFDIDQPGKDSYRLRHAGARQTLVASARRWALITEHELREEPDLATLLAQIDREAVDLVLVEGFKHEHYPKLELRREALDKPRLYPQDRDIVAVITDCPEAIGGERPTLDINRPEEVVEFLLDWSTSKD